MGWTFLVLDIIIYHFADFYYFSTLKLEGFAILALHLITVVSLGVNELQLLVHNIIHKYANKTCV